MTSTNRHLLFILFGILIIMLGCKAESRDRFNTNNFHQEYEAKNYESDIIPAAERTAIYSPKLKHKKIGVVANQSSLIDAKHLIDSLIDLGIDVQKVFTPEHGFKGNADAGEKVKDGYYKENIPIVSLYGKHRKPKKEDLEGLDIIIFDLQDVGARFYTYISTLHYVMQSCAENNVPLMVLDRPNPNGYYVDGPVLKKEFSSFVGMHEVPIVYGMSIGEYALMINGEDWLGDGLKCNLDVIPCKQYDHTMTYDLPVPPSPNLPNLRSILLYPSLCLFEGTKMSIGRGTDTQFQVIGNPEILGSAYQFTPVSSPGAKHPKCENEVCYGENLTTMSITKLKKNTEIDISWLLKYYKLYPKKDHFFKDKSFDRLAGSDQLRNQIIAGISEEEIRSSWKMDLSKFKRIRKKYLIYDDFVEQ